LNAIAWVTLLTAACVGTIVAVVLKPGFGKPSDYLLAFGTSFGIPTIGTAVLPARSMLTSLTKTGSAVVGSHGTLG
jgi:hypothetical protein